MTFLKTFFTTIVVLGVIDAVWLLLISKNIYQKAIGFLMPEKVGLLPVVLVYVVLAIGLVFFVVLPALTGGLPLFSAVLRGALLGFVVYAVYDFTNLATIQGWPVWISLIDIAWGTTLSALTTGVVVWILRFLS